MSTESQVRLRIACTGAGGASGYYGVRSNYGGAGGFATAEFTLPADGRLTVVVGAGGRVHQQGATGGSSTTPVDGAGFPNGGHAHVNYCSGGGGGSSHVFLNEASSRGSYYSSSDGKAASQVKAARRAHDGRKFVDASADAAATLYVTSGPRTSSPSSGSSASSSSSGTVRIPGGGSIKCSRSESKMLPRDSLVLIGAGGGGGAGAGKKNGSGGGGGGGTYKGMVGLGGDGGHRNGNLGVGGGGGGGGGNNGSAGARGEHGAGTGGSNDRPGGHANGAGGQVGDPGGGSGGGGGTASFAPSAVDTLTVNARDHKAVKVPKNDWGLPRTSAGAGGAAAQAHGCVGRIVLVDTVTGDVLEFTHAGAYSVDLSIFQPVRPVMSTLVGDALSEAVEPGWPGDVAAEGAGLDVALHPGMLEIRAPRLAKDVAAGKNKEAPFSKMLSSDAHKTLERGARIALYDYIYSGTLPAHIRAPTEEELAARSAARRAAQSSSKKKKKRGSKRGSVLRRRRGKASSSSSDSSSGTDDSTDSSGSSDSSSGDESDGASAAIAAVAAAIAASSDAKAAAEAAGLGDDVLGRAAATGGSGAGAAAAAQKKKKKKVRVGLTTLQFIAVFDAALEYDLDRLAKHAELQLSMWAAYDDVAEALALLASDVPKSIETSPRVRRVLLRVSVERARVDANVVASFGGDPEFLVELARALATSRTGGASAAAAAAASASGAGTTPLTALPEVPECTLLQDMARLMSTEAGADLSLVADPTGADVASAVVAAAEAANASARATSSAGSPEATVRVHRFVMAARSPYFGAMLGKTAAGGSYKEAGDASITVAVTPAALDTLLRHWYGVLGDDLAAVVTPQAAMYLVTAVPFYHAGANPETDPDAAELLSACQVALTSGLTPETVLPALADARADPDADISAASALIEYAVENFAKLPEDALERLPIDLLSLLTALSWRRTAARCKCGVAGGKKSSSSSDEDSD